MDLSNALVYIKDQSAQGRSREEITGLLTSSGWKKEDVDQAFVQLSAPPPPPPVPDEFGGKFLGTIDLLKMAWGIYSSRFWVILGIFILPTIVVGVLGAMAGILGATLGPLSIVLSAIGIISSIVLVPWQQLALTYAVIHNKEGVGFKDAFGLTKNKIRGYWWVAILSGLTIYGGFILLIIPAYFFGIWNTFAIYVLLDEDVHGINALLKSREYVRGHAGGIIGRSFGLGILSLVIFIPVGIAEAILTKAVGKNLAELVNYVTLPLTPIYYVWVIMMYKNLKALKGNFVFEPAKSTRRNYIIVAAIGLLVIPFFAYSMFYFVKTLTSQTLNTKDVIRTSNAMVIRNGLEQYRVTNETNTYPASLNELVPTYIKTLPEDSTTKAVYEYKQTGNGKGYELCVTYEEKGRKCTNETGTQL